MHELSLCFVQKHRYRYIYARKSMLGMSCINLSKSGLAWLVTQS